MLIEKQKSGDTWMFQSNSLYPDSNWYDNDDYYVLPDGSELATKFKSFFPYVDITTNDGVIVGIIELERPAPELSDTEEFIRGLMEGYDG